MVTFRTFRAYMKFCRECEICPSVVGLKTYNKIFGERINSNKKSASGATTTESGKQNEFQIDYSTANVNSKAASSREEMS